MHLFSPDRPRSVSKLAQFCPNGEPLNVLPALSLHFYHPGEVTIAGFFSVNRNSARRLEHTIPFADLSAFLESWLADPEGVAINTFGWQRAESAPPKAPKPVAKMALADLNIDDLDLDA